MKCVRQHDRMLCGAACLSMVSRYYGAAISTERISGLCPPSREGISMLALRNAATDLGFKAEAVRTDIDSLADGSLPAILFWDRRHFVVLYKTGRGGERFSIADPAKGKTTLRREEFAGHWCTSAPGEPPVGIALFLEPTDRLRGSDDGGGSRSLKFLWHHALPYRRHMALVFLGLLLGCVFQLIMPFLTQWIVDLGIRHASLRFIWLVLLGELMIIAGQTATDYVRRRILMHISMRVNISLVSDFIIKLLRLPMAFFDSRLVGDLLQRMEDHYRVQQFLTGELLGTVFSTLSLLVLGGVLLVYSVPVFLVFLAGSCLYVAWMTLFLRKRRALDYENFHRQGENQDKTYQLVTSMQEIKLQDCGRRRRWEWEETQADLFDVQLKSIGLQQRQEAGNVFIQELKNIVVTVMAASAVIDGGMTLGAMLAIQYIVGQLNSPVDQLMRCVYSLQDVGISLERINEIHDMAEEETQCTGPRIPPDLHDPEIRLRDVRFKYDIHSPRHILDDVSVTIPASKVTAIVGASGSGKTTLLKLILGYYDPLSGSVEAAGRDLRRTNLAQWRAACGVVMQDGVLFNESIERNIAVGNGEVDRDALLRAARIAGVDSFVEALPLKYATKVGRDGMSLSKGQRQRILIARAVYKDPQVILLDEATNSLDAANEREIVERLGEFFRGRTVVVIAHRLSTVRDADQIIVMDSGRVVETGTHDSLLADKGYYYNLVKNQLELGD